MFKKLVGIVLTIVIGISCLGFTAFAEDSNTYGTPTGIASDDQNFAEGIYNSSNKNELYAYSEGLIDQYSLYLSNDGNRSITISGKTLASDIMASVGFTDICIMRSNGSSWATEKNISDQLASNKQSHTMNYSTTVSGGYYYKITLNHYAKASGLFGGSQSAFNKTSYIWIA